MNAAHTSPECRNSFASKDRQPFTSEPVKLFSQIIAQNPHYKPCFMSFPLLGTFPQCLHVLPAQRSHTQHVLVQHAKVCGVVRYCKRDLHLPSHHSDLVPLKVRALRQQSPYVLSPPDSCCHPESQLVQCKFFQLVPCTKFRVPFIVPADTRTVLLLFKAIKLSKLPMLSTR